MKRMRTAFDRKLPSAPVGYEESTAVELEALRGDWRSLHRPRYSALHNDRNVTDVQPVLFPDSISACMTAYNEDVTAYQSSLSSIARNVDYFIKAGAAHIASNITICIIVDGIEKMSPSFARYAKQLGIYDESMLDKSADYHLFESFIDRQSLKLDTMTVMRGVSKEHDGGVTTHDEYSGHAHRQRVLLFIKRCNAGKLDSHRCFFEILCKEERPEFILQIDVGTSPHDPALHRMWSYICREKHVAAVSARSHMPVPAAATDLLAAWQYGDIANERVVLWPTELAMGYISVLAGQLCLSRSDSVWMNASEKTAHDPVDGKSTVVKNYLRGLSKLGPFESNMFLAEDRILAMEIVFQQNSPWEVGYTPQASGTIDSCETWNELLCQRRRWICSGLSCRLWLFTRIMEYVRSRNRTTLQKSRIFLASFFHLCYFVGQWVAPAFTAIIYTSLYRLSNQTLAGTSFYMAGNVAYVSMMGLLLVQLIISATGRLNATTERFFSVSIKLQSAFVIVTALLAVAGNLTTTLSTLLWFVVMICSVLGLAVWYAKDISNGMAKSLVGYFVSRPAVAFLLITHSALNSHNTSWGTKGLNRPEYLDDIVESREAGLNRKRQFDWFRIKAVLLMIACNVLFYTMAENYDWIASLRGLQIVAGLLSMQLLMAIVAKACLSLKLQTPRGIIQCID